MELSLILDVVVAVLLAATIVYAALLNRRLQGLRANKAEFEAQRRHMAQQWSDAVDAWEAGRGFTPDLTIPETAGPRFDPRL